MKKSTSGFTIVELLIVIVVIAILAAISIVAYTGIQSRARDNTRTQAVAQIQRALELYRSEHGVYPSHIPTGSANLPAGLNVASPHWGTLYHYSIDTRNNWLANLTNGGLVDSVPKDPVNNTRYFFVYYASGSDGLGRCHEPFYVLGVHYENAANVPSNARELNCTDPNPGGTSARWTVRDINGTYRAVFSNIRTPGT